MPGRPGPAPEGHRGCLRPVGPAVPGQQGPLLPLRPVPRHPRRRRPRPQAAADPRSGRTRPRRPAPGPCAALLGALAVRRLAARRRGGGGRRPPRGPLPGDRRDPVLQQRRRVHGRGHRGRRPPGGAQGGPPAHQRQPPSGPRRRRHPGPRVDVPEPAGRRRCVPGADRAVPALGTPLHRRGVRRQLRHALRAARTQSARATGVRHRAVAGVPADLPRRLPRAGARDPGGPRTRRDPGRLHRREPAHRPGHPRGDHRRPGGLPAGRVRRRERAERRQEPRRGGRSRAGEAGRALHPGLRASPATASRRTGRRATGTPSPPPWRTSSSRSPPCRTCARTSSTCTASSSPRDSAGRRGSTS
ncbi:hypothetical protein SAVIM40S_00136 [Streptomyces avidinii]